MAKKPRLAIPKPPQDVVSGEEKKWCPGAFDEATEGHWALESEFTHTTDNGRPKVIHRCEHHKRVFDNYRNTKYALLDETGKPLSFELKFHVRLQQEADRNNMSAVEFLVKLIRENTHHGKYLVKMTDSPIESIEEDEDE